MTEAALLYSGGGRVSQQLLMFFGQVLFLSANISLFPCPNRIRRDVAEATGTTGEEGKKQLFAALDALGRAMQVSMLKNLKVVCGYVQWRVW